MKIIKIFLIVLVILAVLILALSCDTDKAVPVDVPDTVVTNVDVQDMIDGKQKVVVTVENGMDKSISGDITVKMSNAITGEYVGYDIVYIEELRPGESTYAILWFECDDVIKLTDFRWDNVKIF